MTTRKISFLSLLAASGLIVASIGGPVHADEKGKNKDSAAAQRGGLLPGETRDQKRDRLIKELEKSTGPLTNDQKKHIKLIYAAAGDEMAAARANDSLTDEQRQAIVRRVHGDVGNRIDPVLTEAQRASLKKAHEGRGERRGFGRDSAARNNGEGGQRPGETRDEKRDRLVAELEKTTGPLTADQKKHIKLIYAAAGDEMAAARANDSLTDEQRQAIVRRVHGDVGNRIDPILTEAQRAALKKPREAWQAKRAEEKKEQD